METQPTSHITEAVRSLIGAQSDQQEATEPVERGAVRRFVQAILDDDPAYRDEQYAQGTKFGGVVAPPLFPTHMFRRRPDAPDPLDVLRDNPDWDGVGGTDALLPPVPVPLGRILNGGVEAEFHQLAKVGDRVFAKSRYVDIYEKEGKAGKMVFTVVETSYTNQDGALLAVVRNTIIRR